MPTTRKTQTKSKRSTPTAKASADDKKNAGQRKRRQYLPAEERKKKILQSSRQVFSSKGLQGARTRELAEAAGINQATLFEHFGSKEELFIASIVEPLVELVESQRQRSRDYAQANSSDDLFTLLENGMRTNLESAVEIYPLLKQALFSDEALGKKIYCEHLQPMFKQRAKTMKGFSESAIDTELLELASFGIFFSLAMEHAMTGKKRNIKKVSKQLTELMLYGSSGNPRPDKN